MEELIYKNVFDVDSDLVVIPISSNGSVSQSFKRPLEQFDIAASAFDRPYKLGEVAIYPARINNESKYVAFACTVDDNKSAYYVIRLIGKSLARHVIRLGNVHRIATPALGTGAGNLDVVTSLRILQASFFEIVQGINVEMNFCVPSLDKHRVFVNKWYDQDLSSGRLVLDAEIPNIRINENIMKVQYDHDFHFDLAQQKYQEFVSYREPEDSFYENLRDKFKNSKFTFQTLLSSDITDQEREFVTLCGELIAYIDSNAYRKNIWNKYSDKRTLAKANVRMGDWFLNLIKFKQANDLGVVSSNIRNALIYLESPEHNLTMLSENHRRSVFQHLFPDQEHNEHFFEILFDFFYKKEFIPQNKKNYGFLVTRILYLPFIKPIWNETFSEDPLFEDKDVDFTLIGKLIEDCLKNKSKTLDLGNCGLRNLSDIPELFECVEIEELILSNEWSMFSEGKWKRRTSKNDGPRNVLQNLPAEISKLQNLKVLICGGDWRQGKIKDWNRWGIGSLGAITKLKKLEYLNLSNNRLISIKGLKKVKNLRIAHLNNNLISIYESLKEMDNLEELYLSNNKIKEVSFLKDVPALNTLDLHQNLIRDLTPLKGVIANIGIVNDKWQVDVLSVGDNPLEQPPMAIVELGKDAVLGLFKDIEKAGLYINKDIKIILIGNSEVGKSTLVKYLDKDEGLHDEHPATVWMDEKIIKSDYIIRDLGEECFLHVFDFGGHDYFHDTHHIFFTTNTIYILLWDKNTNNLQLRKPRQEAIKNDVDNLFTQDYPINYWLDSVKYYTKRDIAENFDESIKSEVTYNSSLLLVQNKVADAGEIVFQNNRDLFAHYPFIYDIINVSIKDPERHMKHFDKLLSEMLNEMEIIGAALPKFYERIKNDITIYKDKPIHSFSEFLNYCNNLIDDPINEDQCRRMLMYLQQVGVLLYSVKGEEEKIYINKKWVIGNMHKILKNLSSRNGKFNRQYVVDILGYDNKNIDDILLMMVEFKMIFKHPFTSDFIAPLYLPDSPGGKIGMFISPALVPCRRFEYKGYIHKNVILSIFQEFGSRIPRDSDTYSYWKNGLIIKDINTEEIIKITFVLSNEDGNACIDVYELSNGIKKDFRDEVLEYIREVNDGFELEEMVTLDGRTYVSKELLERNARNGKYIFTEKKISDDEKTEREEEKLLMLTDYLHFIDVDIKKKRVVISYSKKNLDKANKLSSYLKPLIDANMIEEPWYCEAIEPGEVWNREIDDRFLKADIVFFMISEHFYNTPYIIEREITTVIDRYEKNQDVKIVPIILEYYHWDRPGKYGLQNFSALPFQGKPISSFKDPNVAWYTITASIKRIVKNNLDPGKKEITERELKEIYEKQVKGELDIK